MTRKLGILGALVATLILAFGATEASAKGGMGGGKWSKGGIGLGIGAGIALGVGLAAIAARSSETGCYRERFVNADGDVVIRRICE